MLALLVAVAILAPWISPHDPQAQSLLSRLDPPAWMQGGDWSYPLGSDGLGRDVLSNIFYGLRVSLLVGFVAVAISVVIGGIAGLVAGYRSGGWFDTVAMRLVDIQLSLPSVLIALAVLAVSGRGLWKVIAVIGVTGWAQYARLVRASVLSERGRDYVVAAMLAGASSRRIVFRHLLPNVLGPLLVQISVDIPRAVEAEASLSFLGLGVAVTTPSLGLRVSQGYQYLFSGAWWPSVLPGVALVLLVLSENLIGDWIRDVLDPRTRGARRRRGAGAVNRQARAAAPGGAPSERSGRPSVP
ncbi:MAG TPA: ABC transporter permease [Acetobacteraceae bacterium]|jgi:peptide/nickel transport system permease protein|nr:ABC transporter permease [Acetobacteraceae bacterium]